MAFDPQVPNISHEALADVTAIRENFNQLRKCEAGATEPSNLVAGMFWYDTSANLLKLRDEANSAWQNVWDFGNDRLPLDVLAPGELSADATGRAKMANLFIVNALVNDVAATKITGTLTQSQIGSDQIGQAQLKKSYSSVNTSQSTTSTSWVISTILMTLPGGAYGFYPQVRAVRTVGAGSAQLVRVSATIAGLHIAGSGDLETQGDSGYQTRIALSVHLISNGVSMTGYAYAQQYYITASGEVHWVFILRDKTTKRIISMWQAPDHPCFGNGGKPEVIEHPFGGYDSTKHEIVVINPSDKEVEEILAKCEVEDDSAPDKDFLEIICEEYEIDETVEAPWPSKEVTVGLPKYARDKKGKKYLADYRFMPPNMKVKPIKKKIPKPEYILCRKLKRK